MTRTSAIDHDDRPASFRGVVAGGIGDLEAVLPLVPDADLGAWASIGLDPDDSAALRVADEGDAQGGSVSEIHRVHNVDHRDHVAARSIPIHGEDGREEPTDHQGPEDAQDRSKDRVAFQG